MLKVKNQNIRWTDIEMSEIKLDKLIIHFKQCKKAEGKAEKTITWYEERLDGFINYLESHHIPQVLTYFNLDNTRDFIINEQKRDISPSTIQGSIRALKAFSSWLHDEDYI